jgi:adenylyltransferase/sulfurtransferase
MTVVDLWSNQFRTIGVDRLPRDQCRACARRDWPWLDGRRGVAAAVLCGRNAVQLSPSGNPVELATLADKLRSIGRVAANPYLLRLDVESYRVTVFADGRSIVSGTDDVGVARAVHARYIGG